MQWFGLRFLVNAVPCPTTTPQRSEYHSRMREVESEKSLSGVWFLHAKHIKNQQEIK